MVENPIRIAKSFDPGGFQADPRLSGLPLASPWRRAGALGVDLVLIAGLTQAGGLGLASVTGLIIFGLFVFRGRPGWRRIPRAMLGAVVGLIAFLGIVAATGSGNSFGPDVDWREFGTAMQSRDPAVRARAIEILEVEIADATGDEAIREMLGSLGVDTGLLDTGSVVEKSPEEVLELLDAQATALRAEPPATLAEVRAALEPWVAGAQLDAAREHRYQLLRDNSQLTKENQVLRDQVENPSLRYLFFAFASDLGLTLGWGGLYFTLFLAISAGRTPGKWLFKLRVARVRGGPVTLWSSFERCAGYAAGIATGFLGFLQIFWDRNRQTVQDAIGGTVVLDDRER